MLDENATSSTSETKLILHLGLYYIVGIVGYVYFLQEFEESIVDTLYFSTAVLTTVRRSSVDVSQKNLSTIYYKTIHYRLDTVI